MNLLNEIYVNIDKGLTHRTGQSPVRIDIHVNILVKTTYIELYAMLYYIINCYNLIMNIIINNIINNISTAVIKSSFDIYIQSNVE